MALDVPARYRVRSYQQEMFEKSMQQNVVVVIDTGGGKTLIAALRIKAELERCPPEQMVWLLAPGVQLCRQQHDVLAEFMPSMRTRLLIGADNMDRWGEQKVWDAALDQVRIVVSTPDVLLDALGHAFVSMSQLALIVFDEAHHCVKNHPMSRIMTMFYHPQRQRTLQGDPICTLPHILGLSASMIMKSNIKSLRTIEASLNCVSVTPRVHRDELLTHVNRPACILLTYRAADQTASSSNGEAWAVLAQACRDGGLEEEVRVHLLQFQKKALYLLSMLGPWPAESFIVETVSTLRRLMLERSDFLFSFNNTKALLLRTLGVPHLSNTYQTGLDTDSLDISHKAECLIDYITSQAPRTITAIVFVERRVTAITLCQLLRQHPKTRSRFRCASFVGSSSYTSRKHSLGELLNIKEQDESLEKFRRGELDVLVSTNTLEEGIDVQACNLVVSFDPPSNLKSFIQRRGRARQRESALVMIVPAADQDTKLNDWKKLEAELIRICQSDRTAVQTQHASQDQDVPFQLVHPISKAVITADSALMHLAHFCDLLPPQPYVDQRPEYAFDTDNGSGIQATVRLPSCMSSGLRQFTGVARWGSENSARKDAAFQAYSGLYNADLLNNHLLPLCHEWGPEADFVGLTTSEILASTQMDVWKSGKLTPEAPQWHRYSIGLVDEENDRNNVCIMLFALNALPQIPDFQINSPIGKRLSVRVTSLGPDSTPLDSTDLGCLLRSTRLLYGCSRSLKRVDELVEPAVLLRPDDRTDLSAWLDESHRFVSSPESSATVDGEVGQIVRTHTDRPPMILRQSHFGEEGELLWDCESLSRRRNWSMYDWPPEHTDRCNKLLTVPASECEVGHADFRHVQFSLALPRLFTVFEDRATAHSLRETIMEGLPYTSIEHTITAISTPAANRGVNYQRYEFIGDSVLKFVVSRFLFASYPQWPEGYLTRRRTHLVCNNRLAAEALRLGLDKFILTEPLRNRTWRYPSRRSDEPQTRKLSTKVLADVMEALIGAAFVDTEHDMVAARECICRLIPAIDLADPPIPLRPVLPGSLTSGIADKEAIVGYVFNDKTLLMEAITLTSTGTPFPVESYHRLEFLGDAVLDLIVMRRLLHHSATSSQSRLTRLRAALVNGQLLGYLNLQFHILKPGRGVYTDPATGTFHTTTREQKLSLWHCLRHDSEEVVAAQRQCVERYERLSPALRYALNHGTKYPWEDLLELQPPKILSDMIESVVGAIYLDCGRFECCEAFLTRIGLTKYLDRLIADHVDIVHPKDQLQILLGSKKVTYEVVRCPTQDYEGELLVDDKVAVRVNACSSPQIAKTRLARLGIERFAAAVEDDAEGGVSLSIGL